MRKLLNKFWFGLFIYFSFNGCAQMTSKLNTYDALRTQKIDIRDSLYILYTVEAWGNTLWSNYAIRRDMYKISLNDVSYFIEGTFYSPDKKKVLVWVGEKMPNAKSIELTRTPIELNKMCPTGPDTIFFLSSLIGFIDSTNHLWKLYPFEDENIECSANRETSLNIMGQYYFEQMKTHQMYRLMQSGKEKGDLKLEAYGYNIQDKGFWDKCWLWQKDTVGSFGLYPFQVERYDYDYDGGKCNKCAIPFKPPIIRYPKEILKLYTK